MNNGDDRHDRWATLAQAAVAMSCSVRTVQRRIAEGDLQTRRRPDGKAEVRLDDVGVSDFDGRDTAHHDDVPGPTKSDHALTLASGAITGWQTAAEQVKTELHRSRRVSGLLGATLAVLVIAGGVGMWWGTRAVTTEQGHRDTLTAQVQTQAARIIELADQVQAERQGAEALADRLRVASSESAVLGVQLDRAMADLAGLQADLDTAQAVTATAWASPAGPVVDQAVEAVVTGPN